MELLRTNFTKSKITVSLFGNFDADGCRLIQAEVDDVIDNSHKKEVELDMSGVDILDSSGIGAIVYMFKRLNERDGCMRIENASGQPLKMMELLRIGHAIPLNSRDEEQLELVTE